MKRVWSWIFLSVLLTSFVNLALHIEPVEARTIIVPDDYSTIQEAVENAIEGDTVFVKNGTYYEHVVVNKRISLVGENKKGVVIDGQGSGIPLEVFADNVVITGFTFTHSNGDGGLTLTSVSNCVVDDNIAEFNSLNGISFISSSNNNIISNNYVLNNTFDGIAFWDGNTNNTLYNNTVAGNRVYGIIIHTSSNNNTITQNRIIDNGGSGIVIDSSAYNLVFRNEIISNTNNWYPLAGAILVDYSSSNNTIFENNIEDNSIGVSTWLLTGSGNRFYHNNFIDNADQTYIRGSCIWDNGCEGNFWSNYNGSDLDNDGVGDTYLPWEGVDNYPLMNVYWNPCDINHDLTVDMKDIGISAKAYGSQPGDPLWNPHADITGQEPLVPDNKVDMRDIGLIARDYGETTILMASTITSVEANSSEIEIYYDNNRENPGGLGGTLPGGLAVNFTTPSEEGWVLKRVKFYGMRWANASYDNMLFYIEVWDNNRNELLHLAYKYSDYFKDSDSKWVTVDIPDVCVKGDFFVCIFPNMIDMPSELSPHMNIGFNNDPPVSNRSYRVRMDDNSISFQIPGNVFIRAIVSELIILPEDLNCDGKIDMKDIGIAAKAYSSEPGDPLWNPHADITGPEHLVPDSKVDVRDIELIVRNFGETYVKV